MTDIKKKPRPRLPMISFRIDDETLAALEDLEAAVGDGVVTRRRRSIAIRKALLEARSRLRREPENM
jgi:hypothetical protein